VYNIIRENNKPTNTEVFTMKKTIYIASDLFDGKIIMNIDSIYDNERDTSEGTYTHKEELKVVGAKWNGNFWYFAVTPKATAKETVESMKNAVRPLMSNFKVIIYNREANEVIRKLFTK
jgi:hypothetical protein